MAFPSQLPAWHKLMERSLWRAATAGTLLARARIQGWASSQQGESQGESSTARLCSSSPSLLSAMGQSQCHGQVTRATPKSRSLWLARHQECPCATRWQLLFRDLPLCRVWHILTCHRVLVLGTALQLPVIYGPGLPGVCRDTGSTGLVPCSHKVRAKV